MNQHRPEARWEFRIWGDLDSALEVLRSTARPTGSESVRDCYLLGLDSNSNVKLREGSVEVKHLIDTRLGFQRWSPAFSCDEPFDAATIERLFDELGVQRSARSPRSADVRIESEELVDQVEGASDSVTSATVAKERHHYTLDGAMAEHCAASFDDEPRVSSLAIEGTDLDELVVLRHDLGLQGRRNVPMNVAAAGGVER